MPNISMVLESILNPKSAEHKPFEVFLLGILFSLVAIWLANFIFPTQSSIMSVMLLTLFFTPFFQRMFHFEEKRDRIIAEKHLHKNFLARHEKAVFVLGAFFLGAVVVYAAVFVYVPDMRSNLFELQLDWFKGSGLLQSGESLALAPEQPREFGSAFGGYLLNNTQVALLFFVLSVLFGSGAIFILAWNASVIAAFLGIAGTGSSAAYGISAGISSIALHGVPEILGYFFVGIAGGILSVALLREKAGSAPFRLVSKDALLWLAMGEILIIIGAALEAAF